MQNLLDQPGSYIEHVENGVTLRLQRTICGAGITRYVQAGADRIAELCTTYTDERIARTHTSQLLQDLRAGQSIDQICGRLTAREQAVLAETEAVVNAADTALAADINATMDEVQQRAAKVTADARAAAELVVAETPYRPVRNTRTRIYLKPLDPAQVRAIRQHQGGVVHAGGGISWVTLRALAEKGYGSPVRVPGRQIITSVRLNEHGLAVANETTEAAA